MTVYIYIPWSLFTKSDFLFGGVLLDKKTEVLDIMIKHGVLSGLCKIFSSSTDEDTLV